MYHCTSLDEQGIDFIQEVEKVEEPMISNEMAASCIAGMLQGKIHIGPAWDKLDHQSQMHLVYKWTLAIAEHKEEAVRLIFADLNAHPILADAWNLCGLTLRESWMVAMQVIIRATVQQ